MRILIVTQYFWPESFCINDLVVGLAERGHKVVVFTGKPNYPAGKFFPGYGFFGRAHDNYQGIPVARVPLIPRGKGGGFRLAINYLSFALLATIAVPFRCRGNFDIILVYEPSPITVGLPAIMLRWLKRTPLMFWVQDLWPDSLSATGAVRARWILRLTEWLTRAIYHACDRVLVQSRAFIDPVARLGVAREDIHYFPNSAEALYRPVEVKDDSPEHSQLPEGFRVMFAGNIGAAQDFGTILAAAEHLKPHPDIHWVILGDGRLLAWVEAEIARRGLAPTVHVLGRHPVESMPHFFALADVMLVTLRREPIFAFTIPAKVQSYLACAKPIVAALDGEGARIVTEADAGVAVPAENPIALANAVLKLYNMSPDQRRAMGLRGRSYFERHFEREMLLSKLDNWMKELKPAVYRTLH